MAEDGKGLRFIVNVRRFDRQPRAREWAEEDSRPSVVLNNLIAKQTSAEDVLSLFAARSREFMIVNSATALHRVARFGGDAVALETDPRLRRLLRETAFLFPPK